MNALWTSASSGGLTVTAYRGEGSCLLAFDLEPALRTLDFVGFSIAVRYPGSARFGFLKNLLDFDYGPDRPASFSSETSPLQTFRWVHVPTEISGDGRFTYRASVARMDAQGAISHGALVEVAVDLSPRTVPDFVNIAFTRAFASSQAYDRLFQARGGRDVLPPPATGCSELGWDVARFEAEYAWLGAEARATLLGFLDAYASSADVSVDALAYDLCEPNIVNRLAALGPRLRIIVDDSGDHAGPLECETLAAQKLAASAGADHVKRMHFAGLQHNKVLIASRGGIPFRVLAGSTNFSLRGTCIQANNLLDFTSVEVAALYARVFEAYWSKPKQYRGSAIEKSWHDVNDAGGSTYAFCFSPHTDPELSLGRVADAVDAATSSVFFAVAFLYNSGGSVRTALDGAVAKSDLFTYGISDKKGNLTVHKPDGRRGVVDFEVLGAAAPPPFKQEWAGGSGISMHHKFVVCDFNGERPLLFTGSSNLSPSGERDNGDNLVCIGNPRVVVPYAIEAVKLFDHFSFRLSVEAHGGQPKKLQRPPVSGTDTWFAPSFLAGTAKFADRILFSRRDSR